MRTLNRNILLFTLAAAAANAGEQVIHERRDPSGEMEAVVSLMDPDKSDPSEYRWVIINARRHDFSLIVNRESGAVYQCIGKVKPWKNEPSQCVKVYDGPVVK